jgi:hypothetical protein
LGTRLKRKGEKVPKIKGFLKLSVENPVESVDIMGPAQRKVRELCQLSKNQSKKKSADLLERI